ncbi:prepilin-type N-terminal cleavage/methylation domain-containing protein [bacterium]|nr:prepilin-type N-terminal cleavage/methylation domain-containing protein [bacterium]
MTIRFLDRRGMTMVELLIALTIFAFLSAVVMGFLTGSRRTYDDTSDRAAYQQSLRAVFSLMARELRSAGCDPSEVGVDGLVGADDEVLRCRMDLDGDGSTLGTNPDEDIRYTYNVGNEELLRTTATGNVVILRNVEDLQFRYFDEEGTPLLATPLSAGDRDLVRFVEIDITGDLGDGETVNYSTRVHIRNG